MVGFCGPGAGVSTNSSSGSATAPNSSKTTPRTTKTTTRTTRTTPVLLISPPCTIIDRLRVPGGSFSKEKWENSIAFSQLKIWRSCTPPYDLILKSLVVVLVVLVMVLVVLGVVLVVVEVVASHYCY